MAAIELYDDEQGFVRTMGMCLMVEGHQVSTASSVDSALRRVGSLWYAEDLPDFFLLDANLSKGDESCADGNHILSRIGQLSLERSVQLDIISISTVPLHEAYDLRAYGSRFPSLHLYDAGKNSETILSTIQAVESQAA